MDLLKDHPELAPNVLKLLSEALTASQLDAQALERRLAEQKSNDASESLNLVLDENAQLRLELDEALKAKEEDAESGGLLLLRIADLESELAQLQSERKRDEMQFHETITAFDSDLSQLRADSAHDKEQVMRSRETIDKARDQWSKNEVAHQQALKALNDRYAELETNRDSLQQNTFAKLESRDRDVQRTTKEKEQIRAEKERYQRDLQALRKASEAERKDRVAVEQSVQSKHTAEVNTLEAEVKRLNQRLKDNDGALKKERNGTKRATNSKVGALEAEVERLEEQLKSLAQNMSAQKDKAYQEVKVVNENLARSREEATELKGCLAKNEATLAALRSEGEAGTRRVSLLSEQLGSLQAKIRQRDEEYDDLSSRYLAFKEQSASAIALSVSLPTVLDTHEGERLRLQESNTELQKDLGSLRTQYLKGLLARIRCVEASG
ncbi:hypothetical protein FB45DRAFT_75612 [Roridomyces roridus]|uniref:Uncharacterized protein n=1 Tax=Roridomyces roridus TaxID=1738132 RepID=A0AAD7BP77_9AGAR|nr:hypothetical protein FB45DRAFT_75612 [Roridomyces roridus]